MWGVAGGITISMLVWITLAFGTLVVTPYLGLPYRPTLVAVLAGASALAALRLPSLARIKASLDVRVRTVLAASVGPVLWAIGIVAAIASPRGSAMSWAVLDDSSLDIWATMTNLRNDGLVTTSVDNPRPLEHALTSSLVPAGTHVDLLGSSLSDMLVAHAANWTIAIMGGSMLAGLLSAEVVRRLAPRASHATWVAASVSSIAILVGPATGFFLYRGQINANIMLVLVYGAVAIALAHSRAPQRSFEWLIVTMTLLMLLWTPFAAVPGVLAIVVAWRSRAGIFKRSYLLSIRPVCVAGFFLWCFVVFTAQQFVSLANNTSDGRLATVTIETYLPAPLSWWIAGTLAAAVLCGVWMATRAAADASWVLAAVLVGIIVGAAPIFAARGGFSGSLEYYPSRYVQMSEVALIPLAVGAVAAMVAIGGYVLNTVAGAMILVVVAASATADLPSQVKQWTLAPLLIAQGDYYGPDNVVFDRIVEYASDGGARLPVHLDIPYDDSVRRMLSVDVHSDHPLWYTPLRGALRNRIDDGADRVCDFGRAAETSVTIVTKDPGLEADATRLCTSAELENVRFETEAQPEIAS